LSFTFQFFVYFELIFKFCYQLAIKFKPLIFFDRFYVGITMTFHKFLMWCDLYLLRFLCKNGTATLQNI